MLKDVYKSNNRDAKHLSHNARPGDELYVLEKIAQRLAPYEDPYLYQRYVVSGKHPILGGAMVGSMSVEDLLARHGEVYTSPPRGVRGMHEPGPQVAGPLGSDTKRYLDKAEIEGLEKQSLDARKDREKAGRKGRWL